jgi:hypothetical protein
MATMLTDRKCTISLQELRAAPFLLTYNQVVVARVKSANEFGESDYSQTNILGATIRTEAKSVKGLEYLPLESNDIINSERFGHILRYTLSIRWQPLVTAVDRGNEPILTYHLLWDDGTDGATWFDI